MDPIRGGIIWMSWGHQIHVSWIPSDHRIGLGPSLSYSRLYSSREKVYPSSPHSSSPRYKYRAKLQWAAHTKKTREKQCFVMDCTKKLKFFPSKGGISKHDSPHVMVTQRSVDHEIHPFGTYVQAHNEPDPSNTQHPRTLDCIYCDATRTIRAVKNSLTCTLVVWSSVAL